MAFGANLLLIDSIISLSDSSIISSMTNPALASAFTYVDNFLSDNEIESPSSDTEYHDSSKYHFLKFSISPSTATHLCIG